MNDQKQHFKIRQTTKNKRRSYCYMVFNFNKNDDVRLRHDVINLSPPHLNSAHFPPTHLPFTLPLHFPFIGWRLTIAEVRFIGLLIQ